MAWDVAAYGITLAVLAIAAACVIGIARFCLSLRRLDAAVKVLGVETEASLLQCRQMAIEAKAAIADSRQSLQGFVTLAEGARALGEAVHTAAQTAAHVTAFYRDRLISSIPVSSVPPDPAACELPELTDIGRSLWSLWKRRSGIDRTPSDNCQNSGTSADPSQGE
jgi:hypothetical protein